MAENAAQIKEHILSFIQARGPSLPVHVARSVNLSPLFASAFLSELYNESKLLMSHLRVGSSPLYLIKGQEEQLEKSIEHLNQREKEAFFLIKNKKVIQDEAQSPVMRVALRAIKDFALPYKHITNNQEKIYWRYHLIPEQEASMLLNLTTITNQGKPEPPKIEVLQPLLKTEAEIQPPQPVIHEEKPITQEEDKKKKIKTKPKLQEEPQQQHPQTPKTQAESEFGKKVISYLEKKNISLLHILEEEKKELTAIVSLQTPLGQQEFLLTAKDKKKLSDADLSLAHHTALQNTMPALLLSTGDLDKKALTYLAKWKSLIKVEKLK